MTQQEIQAIRDKYKYNPSTLNTGVSSPTDVNTRLAIIRGETPVTEQEKTLGQKAMDIGGSIISPVERLGASVAQGIGQIAGVGDLTQGGTQATGLFGNKVDILGTKGGQVLDNTGVAKDIAGNVLQNVALLTPAKVTSLSGIVKTGALTGGEFGAGQALEKQGTVGDVATGAVTGAATGAALGGAIKGGGTAIKAAYNKLNPSEQFIQSQIVKQYTKGVKPILPGKTTPTLLNKYNDDVVTAVKTIKGNKANLSFTDESGDIITGQTPKNISQLNDAVEQSKKSIYTKYNEIAQKAGGEGATVDVTPIANELDSIISNKALSVTNPNAIQYAQNLKERLSAVGKLDAVTAQEVVQNYNKSLEAFYRNPSYDNASQAAIDSVIANNLRKSLDESISKATGAEYQALKNQYGALKSIERDVIKASLKEARKNTKGLIDFTDIMSGGQVANGILSLNPAMVASGATQKAIAALYKHINDPNRAISKMFEAADIPVGGIVKKLSKSPRGMINFSEWIPDLKAQVKSAESALSTGEKVIMAEDVASTLNRAGIDVGVVTKNNVDDILERAKLAISEEQLNSKKKAMSTPGIKMMEDRVGTKKKVVSSLEQEAKKYKSAEEFVKAQGTPVYHGSKVSDIIEKEGFKLLPKEQRNMASAYGDGIYLTTSKSDAKGWGGMVNARIPPDLKLYKAVDSDAYKIDTQKLVKEGYDGVKVDRGNLQHIVIFNPTKIKTKSQLTDIWNKANKK